MERMVYSVCQINNYVKRLFDKDAFLSEVFVRGEISNLKFHSSGHIYFTLKDRTAQINCVMFSSYARELKFLPETGSKVTVYGSISLYEKTGAYQLYVRIMEPEGIGALYLAYERLKARLEKAGLFDKKHKKPLPDYPGTVAVITSPTGAAVRDIISIAKRRNPNVEIVVAPVIVQGESAAGSIVSAIEDVNRWGGADVIILGRGGGSIEDLWAFNDERVARAIFYSKIPIVSAVGHETDFTISDFIADLRAPTPSAAAEIVIPKSENINETIALFLRRINGGMQLLIENYRQRLGNMQVFFASDFEADRIGDTTLYVSRLLGVLNSSLDMKLKELKSRFEKSRALVGSLSPINVVDRGYVIVTDENGNAVTSAGVLGAGDNVKLWFKDGSASAQIGEINGEEKL